MGKLPGVERAVVSRRKVTDYLLSDKHPDGASKAAFLKLFDFERGSPETPETALLSTGPDKTGGGGRGG